MNSATTREEAVEGERKGHARTSPLKAVIFDMDGVIADTEPLHSHAYLEVLKTLGIEVSENQYRKAITEEGKTIAAWFLELGGKPDKIDELYRRKDQIYFPLLKEHGSPRPGLFRLLSELKASHVACALATSARRVNAEFIVDLFGLRDLFSVILALEDVTHVKPHPEVFLLALEHLSVQPNTTIVLEDAPKGVRAAVEAGIAVIAVPTSWTRHYRFDGATLVVESIEDLTLSRLRGLLSPQGSPWLDD
jgi:HAD superfamily hydrolase (TIGR01509 family)